MDITSNQKLGSAEVARHTAMDGDAARINHAEVLDTVPPSLRPANEWVVNSPDAFINGKPLDVTALDLYVQAEMILNPILFTQLASNIKAHAPTLSVVRLRGYVNSGVVNLLKQCPNLRVLLMGSSICQTNMDLVAPVLQSMRHLEHLSVRADSAADVERLALAVQTMPRLRELSIYRLQQRTTVPMSLWQKRSLQWLRFAVCNTHALQVLKKKVATGQWRIESDERAINLSTEDLLFARHTVPRT